MGVDTPMPPFTMNAAAPFRGRPRGGSMTVKNQKKWWKKNNVAPPCLGEALRRVPSIKSEFIFPIFMLWV